MKYNLDQIKQVLNKKKYTFFEEKYKVNIIGVRMDNTTSNSFDDLLYLIYRDDISTMQQREFPVTTDPGTYWLKNPANVNGTAILIPGQYKDSYTIRKHQGKYEALCQQKPLKVWRDSNKNNILDFGGKEYEGIYGINIHRSNSQSESIQVDKWSAGCTVFKRVKDFNFFMDICRKSAQLHSNNFTYTLLTAKDF